MSSNNALSVNPMHALAASSDIRVGRIVDVKDGRPFVEFDGARLGPILARVAVTGFGNAADEIHLGHPVLLVFENGDPCRPIIIGLVSDVLPGSPCEAKVANNPAETFELNGKRLSFEGQEEVVLRCGQASITLRADGQVIVKGTRLMSRASETNKVRGATVLIN
jgi:hypothetical protein